METEAGSFRIAMMAPAATPKRNEGIYSIDERRRRDSTIWTTVQGILAPVQFFVFLVSIALIARYFMTGEGLFAANLSIVIKTLTLYAIMITGSIWEKVVFGQYLFARSFFWEDVFSIVVLALHTAYLVALWTGSLAPEPLLILALLAYATYVINAGQFLWKLRQARKQPATTAGTGAEATA